MDDPALCSYPLLLWRLSARRVARHETFSHLRPMSYPVTTTDRQSSAVRNSFVITAVTAFAIVGYFVAFRVAALIIPDAADFYRQGGSISTQTLHNFYWLWGLGVCAIGFIGVIVGRGFYVAWQRR
jgi:hypothetical protein